jgi:predicted RND superfamily exporter protein
VVSGIRPVIDFGWMMVIGLAIAFVISFLLIPSGLLLLPKVKSDNKEDKSAVFTLLFSRFTEKYGRLILIVATAAIVVSIVGMSRLKVENRFIDYFHSSTEIHQGMLVIDQQLGGTITLDIILDRKNPVKKSESLAPVVTATAEFSDNGTVDDPFAPPANTAASSADDPFGAADPFASPAAVNAKPVNYWFTQAGMERIEDVHDYLDGLSEVGKVQSLATVYKVARDLNGKSLNDFELALMRQALPADIESFLVAPYLAGDRAQTRITMRIKETDPSLRRDALLNTIRNHLTQDLGFEVEDVHLTGVLVLYNNMLQSLFKSQILTLGAVFFGIMLMFLVLFRSLSISIIALTPNVLAALVVLGGMGLAGIPLDMMTITIAAIAIGIGVDDAVHYIYRFKAEFKVDPNYIRAMHRAHSSIGLAMYYTSVTVIVGFSILALSEFIPSIYFGLLTGLAMLVAIISSLTLLPKLILLLKPLGKEVE